jgi:hypothetical protein
VKNTFYVGNNVKYLERECGKNAQRIKSCKLNSEIKPHSSVYNFCIDLITVEGRKVIHIKLSDSRRKTID